MNVQTREPQRSSDSFQNVLLNYRTIASIHPHQNERLLLDLNLDKRRVPRCCRDRQNRIHHRDVSWKWKLHFNERLQGVN